MMLMAGSIKSLFEKGKARDRDNAAGKKIIELFWHSWRL
jgi:hypothetical protein